MEAPAAHTKPGSLVRASCLTHFDSFRPISTRFLNSWELAFRLQCEKEPHEIKNHQLDPKRVTRLSTSWCEHVLMLLVRLQSSSHGFLSHARLDLVHGRWFREGGALKNDVGISALQNTCGGDKLTKAFAMKMAAKPVTDNTYIDISTTARGCSCQSFFIEPSKTRQNYFYYLPPAKIENKWLEF